MYISFFGSGDMTAVTPWLEQLSLTAKADSVIQAHTSTEQRETDFRLAVSRFGDDSDCLDTV
jgi:hypothetical protein